MARRTPLFVDAKKAGSSRPIIEINRKDSRMSKTGKWSCVSQVDANMFANCPYQVSNDFDFELDDNPSGWRPSREDPLDILLEPSKKVTGEKDIESFLRDSDTDTVDDFYVSKEVILGRVIESKSNDYTRWSSVVRAVIRLEERELERERNRVAYKKCGTINRKPLDVERMEKNGRFRVRATRKNRRIRIRNAKR